MMTPRIAKLSKFAPIALLEKFPASDVAIKTMLKKARLAAHNIIHQKDDRLLVINGHVLFMILLLRWNMLNALKKCV